MITLKFFQTMIFRPSFQNGSQQSRSEEKKKRDPKCQSVHRFSLSEDVIKMSQMLKSCMKAFPLIRLSNPLPLEF